LDDAASNICGRPYLEVQGVLRDGRRTRLFYLVTASGASGGGGGGRSHGTSAPRLLAVMGRGGIENKDSTDGESLESPSPPHHHRRVCMSIHPKGKSDIDIR